MWPLWLWCHSSDPACGGLRAVLEHLGMWSHHQGGSHEACKCLDSSIWPCAMLFHSSSPCCDISRFLITDQPHVWPLWLWCHLGQLISSYRDTVYVLAIGSIAPRSEFPASRTGVIHCMGCKGLRVVVGTCDGPGAVLLAVCRP